MPNGIIITNIKKGMYEVILTNIFDGSWYGDGK
jgi:hypothetical protein